MEKGLIGKSGIYAIKINGEIKYVGGASDFESRYSNHKSNLFNNKHKNKELLKYFLENEKDFNFIILEYCNKKDLYVKEKQWKEVYKETLVKGNDVIKMEKKVRRGRCSSKHKEKFSEVMAGENNPNNTKLSKEDVLAIRRLLLLNTYTTKEMSKIFECSSSLINSIKNNKRWSSVQLSDNEIEKILKEKEAISFAGDTTSKKVTNKSLQTLLA